MVDCGGLPLPLSGGYRVPWRRHAAARLIASQRPDVIEAGDPYRLAWAATRCRTLVRRAGGAVLPQRRRHAGRARDRALRAAWRADARKRWRAGAGTQSTAISAACALLRSRAGAQPRDAASTAGAGVRRAGASRWASTRGVPPPRATNAGARRWGCLPTRGCCCTPGRFAPEKNLPQLVEAVQRLGPRYHLLALGAGPQPPPGEQVHVLDFEAAPAQVATRWPASTASCMPAIRRPAAWPCWRPWPAARRWSVRDAGGLAEAVADGCGIAVDSDRADDWAEAIAEAVHLRRAPACTPRWRERAATIGRWCWPRCSAATRSAIERRAAVPHAPGAEPARHRAGGAGQRHAMSVTLHDVAPATQARCERLLAALERIAPMPFTLLVVPYYHGQPSAPPFDAGSTRAAARRRAGAARPDPSRRRPAAAAWSTVCGATGTPTAKASSAALDAAEATRRLQGRAALVRAPRLAGARLRRAGLAARATAHGARCARQPFATPARARRCCAASAWPTSRCVCCMRAASSTARARRGAAPCRGHGTAGRARRAAPRAGCASSCIRGTSNTTRCATSALRLVARAVDEGREPLTLGAMAERLHRSRDRASSVRATAQSPAAR